MSELLKLTIVFEPEDDAGWIVASVPEVPGTHSQGRTRDEARENVIDALHGILELRFGEHALAEPAEDTRGALHGPPASPRDRLQSGQEDLQGPRHPAAGRTSLSVS
jgi:predicted RNase H-like HicB family nuclease